MQKIVNYLTEGMLCQLCLIPWPDRRDQTAADPQSTELPESPDSPESPDTPDTTHSPELPDASDSGD